MQIADDLMPEGEMHPQLLSPRVKRTSKAVFEAIIEDGFLSLQRRRVYRLLFTHGPLTGREINDTLKSPSGHKRLSELKRLDVVDIYGTKHCRITERIVEAWDVTGRMPLDPSEATSPNPKKPLLEHVAMLHRLKRVLRKRPIPGRKEKPEDFLGRYLVWLSQNVAEVIDDIEEEVEEQ